MLLNDQINPVYLYLLTVFQCEPFLLLRVRVPVNQRSDHCSRTLFPSVNVAQST